MSLTLPLWLLVGSGIAAFVYAGAILIAYFVADSLVYREKVDRTILVLLGVLSLAVGGLGSLGTAIAQRTIATNHREAVQQQEYEQSIQDLPRPWNQVFQRLKGRSTRVQSALFAKFMEDIPEGTQLKYEAFKLMLTIRVGYGRNDDIHSFKNNYVTALTSFLPNLTQEEEPE